jgi:hypothetical protein
VDPLTQYGPFAGASMLRQAEMPHNGDIVVISRLDDYTHEVAAFEELVGSHGGMGGAQSFPFVLHPVKLDLTEDTVGPEAVHRELRRWLVKLGHPEYGDPAARSR